MINQISRYSLFPTKIHFTDVHSWLYDNFWITFFFTLIHFKARRILFWSIFCSHKTETFFPLKQMLKFYHIALPLIRTLRKTELLQNSWQNRVSGSTVPPIHLPCDKRETRIKGKQPHQKSTAWRNGSNKSHSLVLCVRSNPPVKQLSSLHRVLGWQYIFLLEHNWFALIYSLYILCLCSEQMYSHIFMYYHCSIAWKTYCLNLLKLPVLIDRIMKYIWCITSVSKPWGGKEKKNAPCICFRDILFLILTVSLFMTPVRNSANEGWLV